jgi:hypothetical protein
MGSNRFGSLRMAAAAAGFLSIAAAAAAQTRPPFEVGVGFGGVATVPYEDILGDGPAGPAFDVRATAPLSRRFAVEAMLTAGRSSTEFYTRSEGLFLFQLRQRLESTVRGPFHAFLTYGATGYWAHVNQKEVRFTDNAGREIVSPAYRYTEIDEPVVAVLGGGVHYALGRRAAIRADIQYVTFVYIPLGVRFAGGVSIPLGGSFQR